jgi:microcystin-dependent protein
VQPSVIPVGVIEMFAGSAAPNGWLVCDGSTVSRKTYSDLFKIIGTTYGAGNSNDTFTLPDMRGRCPIGVGTGTYVTATARTLASTTGAESATLLEANLPSHAHAFTPSGSLNTESSHTHGSANAGSHQHTGTNGWQPLVFTSTGGGANLSAGTSYQRYNMESMMNAAGDHSHGSTNSNTGHTHTFTGSGGTTGNGNGTATAVSLMQPAIAINFIIKA